MFLRRIAKGLRDQDWFVVALEVAVVVVGIFLGLQVDDWNQSRIDRLTEESYLNRMYESLAVDVGSIERSIELAENRRGMGNLLLAAIDDVEIAKRDPNAFFIAIEQAGYTESPTIDDYAFEELKDSGTLTIIENVTVREAITSYYRSIERYDQWRHLREFMQTTYMDRKLGILLPDQHSKVVSYFGDGSGLGFTDDEAEEALKRIIARPDFVEQIGQGSNNQQAINVYKRWRDDASELRLLIAQQLGISTDEL